MQNMNAHKRMTWMVTSMLALASGASSIRASTPEPGIPVVVPGQSNAVVTVNLSPAATEVVRLTESSVSEDVVLAYVKDSAAPYTLNAEQVLYLRVLGFSSEVIAALLARDKELASPEGSAASTNRAGPTSHWISEAQTNASNAAASISGPAATQENAAASAPSGPAPTYSSNPPVVVNYFYNDLAPYGTWVVLDNYGWCWQPRTVVINAGWRPYCHGGHWVYT